MRKAEIIALAGLVHDLGKFLQRTGKIATNENQHLYCKRNIHGNLTHHHAPLTAEAIEELRLFERIARSDLFKGDDSFINMASCHHDPRTHLQWIVAIGDRISSGFEREQFEKEYNQKEESSNYLQARLMSPFEMMGLADKNVKKDQISTHFRYALNSMQAGKGSPIAKDKAEPVTKENARKEYQTMWTEFLNESKKMRDLPETGVLLEALDTLLMTYTSYIPSATAFGTMPTVSLYDHSKSTAAFATALYEYHQIKPSTNINTADEWEQEKFILIQGDFFGIQDFIFSTSIENNKKLAKTLRGKSAMVSLITELSALEVVEQLGLSSCSIVQNAAGKFLIIAANTPKTVETIQKIQTRFNQWFLDNTFGLSGIGLAWVSASCNDFIWNNLGFLLKKLGDKLDLVKAQKFNLQSIKNPVFSDYLEKMGKYSPCKSCDIRPATQDDLCELCHTYTELGTRLARSENRILFVQKNINHSLFLDWNILYKADPNECIRIWDVSLPEKETGSIFHGYARRNFKAYIPLDSHSDPKTFEMIACATMKNESNDARGAISVLKADIDDLGYVFSTKLPSTGPESFAKYNMVSRTIDQFFSIHLPFFLEHHFPDIYTVFAGGDDLFLIGPWDNVFAFLTEIHPYFGNYFQSEESAIHFSAGLNMYKPGTPMGFMARTIEEELEQAKKMPGKHSVRAFSNSVHFNDFNELMNVANSLERESGEIGLSQSFKYHLPVFARMREKARTNPEYTIWNSQLRYLGYRTVVIPKSKEPQKKQQAIDLITRLGKEIEQYGKSYEIALFKIMYKERLA